MKKQIWMIFLILLIGISIVGIATVSAEKSKVSTNGTTSAVTIYKDSGWTHGTDFNVEYPSRLYRTDKKGWGTQYWGTQSSGNWFHIAVPTTVISDGNRNQITRAWVLYRTTEGARIKQVDVWDGPNKIYSWSGNLYGDHSHEYSGWTAFTFPTPKYVYYGIGISVRVQFGDPDTAGGSILFTSAGADFYQ